MRRETVPRRQQWIRMATKWRVARSVNPLWGGLLSCAPVVYRRSRRVNNPPQAASRPHTRYRNDWDNFPGACRSQIIGYLPRSPMNQHL